jgi:hypothetical protein
MNNMETHIGVYLPLALLLLIAAYIVFRLIVRRDYLARDHLGWLSSSLQLVIFAGIFSFPYIFNPPEWALEVRRTNLPPCSNIGAGYHYIGLYHCIRNHGLVWFGKGLWP